MHKMSRLKHTEKIDVIGNLDLRPEKAVGFYLESKQHLKFLSHCKKPNWDAPPESIDLLYVRNLREHEHMKRLQDELRKHNKETAQKDEERIRYMHKVTDKLRQRFIDANTFMRDTQKKRVTAASRIESVIQSQQNMHQSIAQYKQNISDLEIFCKQLTNIVEELLPYENIIEDVLKKSDTLLSTKDCMDRCDALMLAQKDISRLHEEKIQEIEKMRSQMLNFSRDAVYQVLGIKTKLSTLERLYAQATIDCQRWEQILLQTQKLILDYTLSKERCISGIAFTYTLLAKRLPTTPQLKLTEVEKMLDFIKDEVEILNKVLQEFNKQDEQQQNGKKT